MTTKQNANLRARISAADAVPMIQYYLEHVVSYGNRHAEVEWDAVTGEFLFELMTPLEHSKRADPYTRNKLTYYTQSNHGAHQLKDTGTPLDGYQDS